MSDPGLETPGSRDLCTRDDVIALVPGYQPAAEVNRTLDLLIRAESEDAHELAEREFVAITPAASPRLYDIDGWNVRERRVKIGDAASIATVQIIDADQSTVLETVVPPAQVALPRIRQPWEPITELWFPRTVGSPAQLGRGRLLSVTATFGFPSIPRRLAVAVAKMVLVRYLADAADTGTQLSEALNDADFAPAAAFASARETILSFHPRGGIR